MHCDVYRRSVFLWFFILQYIVYLLLFSDAMTTEGLLTTSAMDLEQEQLPLSSDNNIITDLNNHINSSSVTDHGGSITSPTEINSLPSMSEQSPSAHLSLKDLDSSNCNVLENNTSNHSKDTFRSPKNEDSPPQNSKAESIKSPCSSNHSKSTPSPTKEGAEIGE